MEHSLTAVSSVDGRYRATAEALSPFLSEYGLIKNRVRVECEYLLALMEELKVRKVTKEVEKAIRTITEDFSLEDAEEVKRIESETNHDVKAVEYFIAKKLEEANLSDLRPWIHFALTSEDVNNISYALALSDALEQVIAPDIEGIVSELSKLADQHAATPMLARTHGQPATPTTFGKECRVFVERLKRRQKGLASIAILAKLNGATGNWNAHAVAYPGIDWIAFSERFIERFNDKRRYKLEANSYTTQIESHDSYVAIFDTIRRVNVTLLGLSQDIWRYISDGWITQKAKAGEVGSSTMPHKVNPIDFENAEGNFGVANALFEHFAHKLPISRLQRDLSDSTVERVFGTAFAHTHIAYQALLRGFGKIAVNETKMREALGAHPEVLAEAIQTVLRREGEQEAYEKLKDLTRGSAPTLEDIRAFVEKLPVPETVKKELLALTPETYLGYAEKIAKGV